MQKLSPIVRNKLTKKGAIQEKGGGNLRASEKYVRRNKRVFPSSNRDGRWKNIILYK